MKQAFFLKNLKTYSDKSVITACERQRQEDCHQVNVSLVYPVRPYLNKNIDNLSIIIF